MHVGINYCLLLRRQLRVLQSITIRIRLKTQFYTSLKDKKSGGIKITFHSKRFIYLCFIDFIQLCWIITWNLMFLIGFIL